MRAHHLPISLLAASVVAIATADVTQQVSPTRQAYRVSGMCDFDQLRTASGNIPGLGLNGQQHCAPTATSNVLAYLAGATPGGISGVPNDSWTDRNADEYASSNTLIATSIFVFIKNATTCVGILFILAMIMVPVAYTIHPKTVIDFKFVSFAPQIADGLRKLDYFVNRFMRAIRKKLENGK